MNHDIHLFFLLPSYFSQNGSCPLQSRSSVLTCWGGKALTLQCSHKQGQWSMFTMLVRFSLAMRSCVCQQTLETEREKKDNALAEHYFRYSLFSLFLSFPKYCLQHLLNNIMRYAIFSATQQYYGLTFLLPLYWPLYYCLIHPEHHQKWCYKNIEQQNDHTLTQITHTSHP